MTIVREISDRYGIQRAQAVLHQAGLHPFRCNQHPHRGHVLVAMPDEADARRPEQGPERVWSSGLWLYSPAGWWGQAPAWDADGWMPGGIGLPSRKAGLWDSNLDIVLTSEQVNGPILAR